MGVQKERKKKRKSTKK